MAKRSNPQRRKSAGKRSGGKKPARNVIRGRPPKRQGVPIKGRQYRSGNL